MSWAETLQLVRVAVAAADPTLIELPSLSVETAASTLTLPAQTGFTVNMPGSDWVGDRQRVRVRTEHGVKIDLIATAKQHGGEADTLARVLDLEQAILASVLEIASNPAAQIQWVGSLRGFDVSRVYLLSSLSFVATTADLTGANT